MRIAQSEPSDLDAILGLYDASVLLQREKGATPWPVFSREMVAAEVGAGCQWKIIVDGGPRCIWTVTDRDPLIWGDRDADPAVYIHRIATDPAYRGRGFVRAIVAWAQEFAEARGRRFVRMDTVGDNTGLIRHYTACGFEYLGLRKLRDTTGLPFHYHDAVVSLFEIELGPRQGIE